MDAWTIFGAILDNPMVQDPAAQAVGVFLKAKLPDAAEKAIADFLRRVAEKISPAA